MFEKIEDEILLVNCKIAVEREKKSTARVLEYLSEIDRRRLWLKEGYSSLYDFCIRFLNYSESETHRRVQAARLSVRVEGVKPLLESGNLSLTTMSLLSPHLTQSNAKEILPKVMNQPTREVEKVLRRHFPEAARKIEVFKVEKDDELNALLARAQELSGEREGIALLKKVLRAYTKEKRPRASKVLRHTHYVPVPLAREVKRRSGYQCEYISPKGIRCNQKAHPQVDHIRAYAKGGGSHDIENLRCLCRAHNLMLAKIDFPNWQKPNGHSIKRPSISASITKPTSAR